VYYGRAGYGIKNASNYYFSKDVSQLGLEESAIITGIIQIPTLHSPLNVRKV
jgi:membrane peptidoglycan carboxypeptidase